jgi:hypothetical protein
LKSGLASISYRHLEPKSIIDLCVQCGLDGIEWGADVHVPPADTVMASQVSRMTLDAGLCVAAYGSYYVPGGAADQQPFEAVLESAAILNAPVIRIWAGRKASAACTEQDWQDTIEDSRRVADLAARENIRVAYEYHQGTLTDTNESAQQLLEAVDHANMFSFWQPPNGKDKDYCVHGLQALIKAGRLSSVHVFHWWPGFRERHLLSQGADRWITYLKLAGEASEDRFACLEFSKDDNPDNTRRDARTLAQWIKEVTV